ncbi:2-isopropylmalate synthase [Desulforhopalus vacuolatus]|uniref:2-isopropylmalate synthase n=1 Tax=Desulforhopalus vacuolatus TaxID=40414 RepID=UPI0019649A13|nr:2-isopropylmalate synthase [Desulforhopalus vacuolatus]MBM9520953.1 2-isopropylmalate synthase [Desulforhopalus vacuolatus]
MTQQNNAKYKAYPFVEDLQRTWPDKRIEKAPVWCSVDLRDGNQALNQPMDLKKKKEMFQLLCEIGFKEIEVGFPSAAAVEYDFIRALIEQNLIPPDVVIQVLTQARPHLIEKTYESLKGVKEAIVHLYNSTSILQRKVVFRMKKQEIIELAVQGAKMLLEEEKKYPETKFRYEYSPESFTGTELEFSLEICERVMDVMQPTKENRIILNLPATVEMSTPNIYADMIEWFSSKMNNREAAIISLHAHNDRGSAVAATELALMAGADRVEGTLFGNGERTGNVDIVTLALNMFSQGVDPQLDMSDIDHIIKVYKDVTLLPVHPRHPYAGELVYTAFSGSHQDAINKGMNAYAASSSHRWAVPYLPIDPTDVGRTYESIIRINSQSGKGGVAYIMDRDYGFKLPKSMQPEFGRLVQSFADREGRELEHKEIYDVFNQSYLQIKKPLVLQNFNVVKRHNRSENTVESLAEVQATVAVNGEEKSFMVNGNGPLDAFCSGVKKNVVGDFTLLHYHEHALTSNSSAKAAAYIEIRRPDGRSAWGVGVDTDITIASIEAVINSLNRLGD